jgi:hypothetical protein
MEKGVDVRQTERRRRSGIDWVRQTDRQRKRKVRETEIYQQETK